MPWMTNFVICTVKFILAMLRGLLCLSANWIYLA